MSAALVAMAGAAFVVLAVMERNQAALVAGIAAVWAAREIRRARR